MLTPNLPAKSLAAAIGLKNDLFLKREDLHPLGSHKGRSLPLMIEKYLKEKNLKFVISSSGNAALAAALYIKEKNSKRKNPIELTIFVGEKIAKEKKTRLAKLSDKNIFLIETERPKQSAFLFAKKENAALLRQSTDDTALIGYAALAKEIAKTPKLSAIFLPASSGTTVQGVWLGWPKKNHPSMHVAQTAACHFLIDGLDPRPPKDAPISLADAIVDKIATRKQKIREIISQSQGGGWIISDAEIKNARKIVKKTLGLDLSANSVLSIAALIKAKNFGWKTDGAVVCLVTGR